MECYRKMHKNMTQHSVRVEHNWTKHLKMQFLHSHSDYEILYIRGGKVSVTCNTETVVLEAPSLVLHHPYMLHRAVSDGESVYERYIVYFNRDIIQKIKRWVPDFSEKMFGCMSYMALDSEISQRLDKYFEEMISCFKSSRINRCEIVLMLLLEDIMSSVPPENICSIIEKHSYINEVLIYISNHSEQNLTVEGIAKQFFISRAKLSADFKEYTGMTVKHYILLTRIDRAKQLMNTEELTLSQVALCCGFCDDSHFINTFRRFEGVTPKEYLTFLHQNNATDKH